MTDVSISDIRRISHKDLEKKIEQLNVYIKRVGQRISALNNFSTNSTKQQQIVKSKFEKYDSHIKVHR
jgi:hypothetical protein